MAPWEVSSLVRNVLGMLGNVTAFGLWCAPVPTFIRIVKEKEVGDFSILPYIATWVNCVVWTYFGLPMVSDDNMTVATINGIGILFSTVFIVIYLLNCKPGRRTKVWILIACSVAFVVILITTTLVFVEKSKRPNIVGPFGLIFSTALYVAPTMILGHVIKTKSVEYMPFLLSVNGLVNTIVWTAYGIYVLEVFILTPNAIGLFLSILQLVVYAMYRNVPPQTLPVSTEGESRTPSPPQTVKEKAIMGPTPSCSVPSDKTF